MFNWKEFERYKTILSHMSDSYRDEIGQHHIHIRPKDLLSWIEFIKDDLGFYTIPDIAGLDLGEDGAEVVYHLLNMGLHQRLNLHVRVEKGEVIPSIERYFVNAEWLEREQAEMLNLLFDIPRAPLILPENQKVYPLKKSGVEPSWPAVETKPLPKLKFNPNKSEKPYPSESYVWKRFDPLSPVSLGHFQWNVCFDPSRVVESYVEIGFHYQGFEKLLESRDIFQILQLVDKINLSSSPHYSVIWSKTIEDMFRIKIPERAQALRIVMLELARIADHLTVLYGICVESNQNESLSYLNAREKIFELLEKMSGQRHAQSLSRIGGVSSDLPHGWIVEYQQISQLLQTNLTLVHHSLIGKLKFRNHVDGDPVNAHSVLQCGVSGPAMRAAGINFDLRKSQPFYFYQDIDFDIPVGINGGTYDRYLIRFEEIFQSLRIITQVIDNLPLGEILPLEFSKNSLELHEYFATLEKTNEWHYSALESSAGEAGYLLKLTEELHPERIKIKTPGFSIAGALPVFMKGLREEQLGAALASLGLSRWEMDR